METNTRMRILGVDPGTTKSAYVLYDTESPLPIVDFGLVDNYALIPIISSLQYEKLVIEMISSYGMKVGNTVFQTCVWIGRFIQTACYCNKPWETISRVTIKTQVCGTPRSNDAGVRAALIYKFGEPGTKKNPGGTYGITKDVWSSLAVCVAWSKLNAEK